MFGWLKDHPFGVEAYFDSSVVFTYAVPKDEVLHLIPPCFSLDTFDDRWAFLAVAMVQTRDLRPKGFPPMFGNDFFLVGYRLFTQFITASGKRLRGLYILKSETDKKKMELFGNLFTHYHYTTTDVIFDTKGQVSEISSVGSGFSVRFVRSDDEPALPAGSPFTTWKEARRFAGPLPFTYQPAKNEVLIIEGVRSNWIPRPLQVLDAKFSFVESLGFRKHCLANAFEVTDIPYSWKRGRKEIWKPEGSLSRVS